jgi:hypothetical protein
LVTTIPCESSQGPFVFNDACPVRATDPCPNCIKELPGLIDNEKDRVEKDRLKAEFLRQLASTRDVNGIISYLTRGNLPEDLEILIPTLIENRQCEMARQHLGNLSQSGDMATLEKESFYRFYDILITICEAGRRRDELTVGERAAIEEISRSKTRVAVNAESFLAGVEKSFYARKPVQMSMEPEGNRATVYNETNMNGSTGILSASEGNAGNNKVTIYPNPSSGLVNITYTLAADGTVEVLDASGRRVRSMSFAGGTGSIQLEGMDQGIYFVLLKEQGTLVYSGKLIITK